MKRSWLGLALSTLLIAGCTQTSPTTRGAEAPADSDSSPSAEEVHKKAPEETKTPNETEESETRIVEAAPLSPNEKKGLEWLASMQNENGGWGQGEESQHMRASDNSHRDKPNVADTCIAALALLRSGSTPDAGPYAENLKRAIDFVCTEIEASNPNDLYVTDIRGTRVQSKIGPYVDTFLSSLFLSEVKTAMRKSETQERVATALDKVIHKMETNQRKNGTWGGGGWAPVISQGLAVKSLNRAKLAGVKVRDETITQSGEYSRGQFDADRGRFKRDGAAGVELYGSSANFGSMSDTVAGYRAEEKELREVVANPATPPAEREKAQKKLGRIADARQIQQQAQGSVVMRLGDPSFVKGFGSNGGEEFLSYMTISESLLVDGGEGWEKWDRAMSENLGRIQNKDGSWTGHHCITGKTFCTASALLVLMADRSPIATTKQVKGS